MPGKHNAGGCGCCGNPSQCWSCDTPTSLTVTAPSGTCCSPFGGTYVFPSDADLYAAICVHAWILATPYQLDLGIGNAASTSGTCVNTYCPITSATNTGTGESYICHVETYTTASPTCRTYSFVLASIRYDVQVRDVSGTPTLTVTLKHSYTEYTNTKGPSVCQQNNAPRTWNVTDTYESTINCNDATTVLANTGRTMTDPDGLSTSSPITWGGTKSYTVCSAPTVTFNK